MSMIQGQSGPPSAVRAAAPVGLVLAAGAGRRLGRAPKALLRLNGVTLVQSVLGALRSGGCSEIMVVTGAGATGVREVLQGQRRVHTVHNSSWAEGMGSSLRRGIEAIGPNRHIMVTPVDRPGITAAEVERVITAHRPGGITAAAHRDSQGRLRRGHPVLFDACWCPAARAAAHADAGARQLLIDRSDIVELVDCSDLEDGLDIDVPADLDRWVRPADATPRSARDRV